jgi:hypothetical protein
VVALVKVKDEAALKKSLGQATLRRQGPWGLIGQAKAVKEVEAYAFGTLAAQAPPNAPSGTIYMPAVWRTYQPEVEEVKREASAALGKSGAISIFVSRYLDVFTGMAEQTERVDFTLNAGAQAGELELTIRPRAGSTFEAFNAGQKTFDPALLERLPGRAGGMLALAQFHLGPLRRHVEEMVAEMTKDDPALAKLVGAMLDQYDGSFSMSIDLSALASMGAAPTQATMPRVVGIYGCRDPRAAIATTRELIERFAATKLQVGGQELGFETRVKEGVVDGAPWLSYQMLPRTAGMTPEQKAEMDKVYQQVAGDTYLVAIDGGVLTTMGGGLEALKADVAAMKSGKTLVIDGAQRAALDAALKRKDSTVMLMDFGVFLGTTGQQPITFSIGFPNKQLVIRISVPPSSLRAAVQPT